MILKLIDAGTEHYLLFVQRNIQNISGLSYVCPPTSFIQIQFYFIQNEIVLNGTVTVIQCKFN